MDVVQVLAVWLHTLALVIVVGYYGVLGRIVMHGMRQTLDVATQASTLMSIERRALPFVLLAVALLVITGTYLLVTDPGYSGLGNFFATTWAALMAAKHIVIVAFVGLGVLVDYLVRDLAGDADDDWRAREMRRIGLCAEGATVLGALAILLTAAAQLSPIA